MFYLTTHSTHFIYGYMASDITMVKDHSDSERGNPLPPHGIFSRLTRVILYAPSHIQDSTYHGLCYTSRGVLAGSRNTQWVHPMKDRSERSYNGATSRSFATGSLIIISVVSVSKPAILSRAIGTPSVLQMYQANVCELIQMNFHIKQKVI